MSVEVGRYGRIILPKDLREKYKVHEGSRLIVTEVRGEIILIPVNTYEKPTEALFGSITVKKPIDEPKQTARSYIRKKLVEGLQ